MPIIGIGIGIVHWCGGCGGRAVCSSAECVAMLGLESRRSGCIVWNTIW